jgi:DNA-binding CsgD family transcriptional regulator
MQWVSLYRSNPHHLYTDGERHFAEFLMPHLGEALTINHMLNLQTVYGESADESGYLAYADMKGFIAYADPTFASLLTDEWPGWEGSRLPRLLLDFVLSNRDASYIGKSIRLDAIVRDELLFLRARKLSKVDKLSPREIDVARRFGEGYSYKEIARLLSISPATVRHHLSAIYAKLDIHDKAQLAHTVR